MLGKDLLKTIVLFFLIIGTTVGSALGLNLVTGPKIAADKAYRDELAAQQAAGALAQVLPGSTKLVEITETLEIDPSLGVTAVHKDEGGKGYVFVATAQGYSKIIEVTVGVFEGKITGIIVNSNGDFAVKQESIDSYKGQDSTLSGVVLGSGATVSGNAAKQAVANGFIVLASNNLMEAAKKPIEQVLDEKVTSVYPTFVPTKNSKGVVTELKVSGNITKAYKGHNGASVVCHVASGDTKLLAIYNIDGFVKVYKANLVDEKTQQYELEEVTENIADIVTEVKTFAASHLSSVRLLLSNKITELYSTATDVTEINVSTFNDVVAASSFVVDGKTYYGFYARPNNGYSAVPKFMEVYVILTSDGKIAKVDVEAIFINPEYFEGKYPIIGEFNPDEYLDGFNDKGSDSIVDDAFEKEGEFYITQATFSSRSVKNALKGAFELLATLGGNN